MRILALEVGSNWIKAGVFDATLAKPLGPIVRQECKLDMPTPEAAEIPANRLWETVTAAVREAVSGSPDVQGVGMTVQSPALVLLDQADRPLLPIWTLLDRRARPAARQVATTFGEEFLAATGNRPLPGRITVIGYRQMLVTDPYLTHKVRSYLHLNGWLGLKMTGERAMDSANASWTGLFNALSDRQWSERWCGYFEVDKEWLPRVVAGQTTVGTLRANVAAEWRVPAGIPVKLGTTNTSSAFLAAKLQAGELLHQVDVTQSLSSMIDRPEPGPRWITACHGVGPGFIRTTLNPVSIESFEWIRRLCFPEQSWEEFLLQSLPLAAKRTPRVTLDPPFLGSDGLEIEAQRAAFRDLTLRTERLDLVAAIQEAMLRGHRQALAALGVSPRRIVLTGEGAQLIQNAIPEYREVETTILPDAALRGVTRLFVPE